MTRVFLPLLHVVALSALTVAPMAAVAQERPVAGSGQPDKSAERRGGGRTGEVRPYIEAQQVFGLELAPGNDSVTYSAVAVGVDATIADRNNTASASLRYERRFGWDNQTGDTDVVSGIARASVAVVPQAVQLEGGALAQTARVDGNGSAALGGVIGNDGASSQIYSGYIGPSVRTTAGPVEVLGSYRFGYTRVESPSVVLTAPGAQGLDVFTESTNHAAAVRAGVRPGVVAPIGVGVGAGWNEEQVANLDQRIRDRRVRADATLPVSPTLAVVGGVGYEDVEVSSRDAVRDSAGQPVIASNGTYVTDEAAPRRIAYQTEGLIWDAGVMWRPSRRTSLEAYIGRRYGSLSGWGSFSYAPNARTQIGISVYDNLTGFGGQVTTALAALPAQFDAFRNPITGAIGGCVANTSAELGGNNCLAGAISSVRSAAFRSRGIAASYALDLGRTTMGIGAGYDRREFVAAPGTILAIADGRVDATQWLAAYASTRLDRESSISANANASLFQSGFDLAGDTLSYSGSLAYTRRFLDTLTGTAAVGLDGAERDLLPDFARASALLGLRYSF